MTTNDELMTVWCRMWSEDPALAYELMTERCVQWSGQTAGLDTVTGPAEQEQFVAKYRAEHVNVFTPRLLIDAGQRFSYLWDVTLPDGTVHTGVDVNVLRDGRIDENWTFVSDRHDGETDPEPQAADAAQLEDLARRWIAAEVDVAGERFVTRRTGHLLTTHREPLIDAVHGRIAILVTEHTDVGEVGGVDVLAVRGGQIAKAWSFSGTRPFRY